MIARPSKIAVMAAGSWGTTFAKILADCARVHSEDTESPSEVMIWARRQEIVDDIMIRRHNSQYLPHIVLPENLIADTFQARVLAGAEVVVLAVPAQSLREQLTEMAEHIQPGAIIVSLMKGLERGTDQRMSEVVAEVLDIDPQQFVVLSGPNLAMEIAREEPTAAVVASNSARAAAIIAACCTTSYFRPYTSSDVVGVEISGIVKNIIALAVGMSDGIGVGDNTKATVITRGLAETSRLASALGAQSETMSGLAGLGDLVATCASSLSRNHTAGMLLGQGLDLVEVNARMRQTAEGVKSAEPVQQLAQRLGVEMPITQAVLAVLNGELSVTDLAPLLMGRELKSEAESGKD